MACPSRRLRRPCRHSPVPCAPCRRPTTPGHGIGIRDDVIVLIALRSGSGWAKAPMALCVGGAGEGRGVGGGDRVPMHAQRGSHRVHAHLTTSHAPIYLDRATRKTTGEDVALKKVRLEVVNDHQGVPVSSLREVRLLKSLHHINIVRVQEVVVGVKKLDNLFMVMEYCPHDMASWMDSQQVAFTFSEVKCLMKQLLKGVAYCHERGIIHRYMCIVMLQRGIDRRP